ncbi:Choline transporter-like protein 2 (Solute carrier family 44 member 2) [Durusdinium trenchii]|uniref:Choline transporter-like protein 2 (Solute carrier family 44 member 2) n=1 Tax=Durusdinium trenchii TaxID=1381693 RepID=A0ABP0QU06_9DINO
MQRPQRQRRKCTDCAFAVLFVVFWVGMVVVAVVGFSTGDAHRLIFATDWEGHICTRATYYPEEGLGICLDECPSAGDTVCVRGDSQCWFVAHNHNWLFFRCVPTTVVNQSTTLHCFWPAFQQDSRTTRMPVMVCADRVDDEVLDETCDAARCAAGCVRNNRCVHVLERQVTESVDIQGGSLLASQLGSWTATLARHAGDLRHTWGTILATGVFFTAGFGLLWLHVLQRFAKAFVWLVIILALLSLILGALLCFSKAGALNDEIQELVSSDVLGKSDKQSSLWYTLGVLLSILACVYFLVLVVMRRKIKLAIAILEEGAKAIRVLKSSIIVPLYSSLCTVVLGFYAVGVFGYLYTSASTDVQNFALTDGVSLPLAKLTTTSGINFMIFYHVLGCLWTLQVIVGVNVLTLAGAVSDWYWRDKANPESVSVLGAFRRTLFWHFGSVCFGALLIAVVHFVRVMVAYMNKQTKRLQQHNAIVGVLMTVLSCCLWCFERVLRFITETAYIMIAIHGCSFCHGAKKAVKVVTSGNLAKVVTVHVITRVISSLSILVIVAAATSVEFLWLESGEAFGPGAEHEINSSTMSVVATAILSFWIAHAFMQVYRIAVQTILFCFCIDVELNQSSKKYYMGKSLRRIFARRRRRRSSRRHEGGDRPHRVVSKETISVVLIVDANFCMRLVEDLFREAFSKPGVHLVWVDIIPPLQTEQFLAMPLLELLDLGGVKLVKPAPLLDPQRLFLLQLLLKDLDLTAQRLHGSLKLARATFNTTMGNLGIGETQRRCLEVPWQRGESTGWWCFDERLAEDALRSHLGH